MAEENDGKKSSIKVVDRRRFTSDGDMRADAPEDAPRPEPPPPAEPPRPDPAEPPPAGDAPKIDFITFIASLATNAMAALGVLPPEAGGRDLPFNPALAKEYIDILGMLQEKTRGNLDPREDQALTRLVSDLRMQYVEISRGGPPQP